MKIKVEIDISDIVTEVEDYGEVGLHEELLSGIKYELKQAVFEDLRVRFLDGLKSEVQEEFRQRVPEMINSLFKDLAENKVVFPKANVYNKEGIPVTAENVTFNQYIESRVFQHLFESSNKRIESIIEMPLRKMVDASVSQLRDRYDSFFAMQIVKKVGEQGMLKPGVLESLLPNSPDDINP